LGETEEIAALLRRTARRRVTNLKRELRSLNRERDALSRIENAKVRQRLRRAYDARIRKKLLDIAEAEAEVRRLG
jgi:hypothetical protein